MTWSEYDNIKLPALIRYVDKDMRIDKHCVVTHKYIKEDFGWLVPEINHHNIVDYDRIYHFINVDIIKENYNLAREQMNEIENLL